MDHLMRIRFGETLECAGCRKDARYYRVKKRRSYACEHCGHQIYPTAGTPFDRTRTPLRDWFFVMFQFCSSRNGVAAKEVERQLGVTYKTAWRMCHMIRAYMADLANDGPLGGEGEVVEIDETVIGGAAKGYAHANKTIVMGMVEKGGDVATKIVPDLSRASLWPVIEEGVAKGSTIHTDQWRTYGSIAVKGYRHMTVNHSKGEYVSPYGASVNSIEGFWSQLKRGITGTHIHVSAKHLAKYLGEFGYRWNMRQTPHLMLPRLMTSFAR